MKFFQTLFIYFSKIYIHFYGDKGDYWSTFPILILSVLVMFNIEVLSFFVIDINAYYYVIILVLSLIIFNFIFFKIKFDFVKNYYIPKRKLIIITISILLNITVVFYLLNVARNNRISVTVDKEKNLPYRGKSYDSQPPPES